MQTGKINVQTENIFPIIKKFLYSDHEIFLRELVSNAVDATQKLKTLASVGSFKDELGDLTIKIEADKKAGTLTVKDRGIGMTAEEVDKYINQIAFSSAEEFVKKFKTKSEAERNAIIGHFGLGFYSSFMVGKKVEILTKTYKKGGQTKGVKWECDGSPDYIMTESERKDRGTDVVVYIDDENKEFLEESRILEILKKYSRFLPVPIQFGMEKTWEKVEGEKDEHGHDKEIQVEKPRIINNPDPLWKKKPTDCTEEDYKKFYRELYPMNFEDPLFQIHLNVDYPFNLTGILYFPKVKRNVEIQKDKIQLYSNQVFVTDSVEGIVPEFLTLLHGVIDSPDIPLKVSRSYLQSDSNVKKISGYIMKKVSEKLEELFKKDRAAFEAKWDDIKVFIEYGMISEEKFYEKATSFVLLKNNDGKYFTLDEYKTLIEPSQKDKDNKIIYLYASHKEEQHSFIQAATGRGYDVLIMDGILDNHFINTLEHKLQDTLFRRVDSDTVDNLIKKEDQGISKLDDQQKETLKGIIEKNIEKEKFTVVFENLSETEVPFLVVQPEFMRRMKDMSALGGGYMGLGNMPEFYNLVVNVNHPVMQNILDQQQDEEKDKIVSHLYDLALVSQNLLKGEKLTAFIRRSVEMMK
ncbi:MAG: molecular chaperone HtpG [Bacteroidales bacterium]|jgi:molecular chaperone HtpG|nr:molecular chaperone HtpG [Bacteroidales bacterium]